MDVMWCHGVRCARRFETFLFL